MMPGPYTFYLHFIQPNLKTIFYYAVNKNVRKCFLLAINKNNVYMVRKRPTKLKFKHLRVFNLVGFIQRLNVTFFMPVLLLCNNLN